MVIRSTVEDAIQLAPRLRKEDVAEIAASANVSPVQALQEGALGTECWSILSDAGLIIGMFGIHHIPQFGANQAAVWMLASDDLVSIKDDLHRETPKWLEHFHTKYHILWNLVDARNTVHLKWLKRLGFSLVALHPEAGPEKRPFYEFVRIPDPSCAMSQQLGQPSP
jgi:hypothetical protein